MATRVVFTLLVGVGLLALATIAVGAEQGESAAAGGISPVPTSWEQLGSDLAIWTAVVFLLLLLVLRFIAWRPIVDGLQRREQRIADEIGSAERSNAEARKLLDEYHQKLAASGEEVQGMLEAARRDAEQVGQQIVEKAQADAEAEHQRALDSIERATGVALRELAEQSATLAVELAGRIVQGKLDPKAHAGLIEQAVADFSRQRSAPDTPEGR
jgi:F-type H+-transporting ATPase subunit b